MECTRLPLVPVIVNVRVPVGVCLVVDSVRVELPAGGSVTEGGVNVWLVFAGEPLTLNVTLPANPFEGVAVTAYVVLLPRLTDRLAGEAEMEKSGMTTTNWTVVVWVK